MLAENGNIACYINGIPYGDIPYPIRAKEISSRINSTGSSLVTSMGHPLGFIPCYSHKLLNGIPLIWAEPIRWVHRLFHCACKTGSAVITKIRGHSLLHQNYFCFKRHLSSDRCRYCFLETGPISRIHYICR